MLTRRQLYDANTRILLNWRTLLMRNSSGMLTEAGVWLCISFAGALKSKSLFY